MTDIDGAAVVAENWPLVGPYTPESLAAAAGAIQELTRYLAHATLGDATAVAALPFAPDGYLVVGRLGEAASSLEQVLRQLEGWTDKLIAPDLRHDDGDNEKALETADAASEHLGYAANFAGDLSAALRTAQGHLGHLYHYIDDEVEA